MSNMSFEMIFPHHFTKHFDFNALTSSLLEIKLQRVNNIVRSLYTKLVETQQTALDLDTQMLPDVAASSSILARSIPMFL